VQVREVRPRQDHPMQDLLKFGVRLSADRLYLTLVAVAAGLVFQECP
jgi:hypothetical protein